MWVIFIQHKLKMCTYGSLLTFPTLCTLEEVKSFQGRQGGTYVSYLYTQFH